MGNVLSSAPTRGSETNVASESEITSDVNVQPVMANEEEVKLQEQLEDEAHAKAKEDEMSEFRKQLSIKREQRREILARHRSEKDKLEKALHEEKASNVGLYESNKKMRELLVVNNIEIPENLQNYNEKYELSEAVYQMNEEFEKLKSLNNKLRRDLAESNSALQSANSDIADLSSQNRESIKQIHALKEVVTVSKSMINLREEQLDALKNKLNEIERTLADRETNLLSTDLRKEYEKQLQNIRTLRGLYEERARLAEVTRQSLLRELDEQKRLYQTEIIKTNKLSSQIEELESNVETLQEKIEKKNIEISSCQDETNELKAEMAVVNKLFSQVLLGYKTKQDLDTLAHRLEENHGILTQMAEKENGSESSTALPKLLLELVSQVDEKAEESQESVYNEEANLNLPDKQNLKNTTPEEIVENLPKVWKVLMELLSHQSTTEVDSSEKVTTCYKSVETKSGPVLVPSVSQTYIRLKDLIIEKLGLIKEVNRMKQLNSHLETRLEVQERRLCLVTTELSKTWHVVSRLRRHHHQLHTHEKILKYELQQKRKLLNELKEELEYCRDKLEQAREKNIKSEKDWKTLRAEFTSRKTGSPSLNNSAESGYSDERPSDESSESNDESEYVAKPVLRCKKKLKKTFEVILDSSADFNLVAEREDPASDMLDVADLPLDTQDGDNCQDAISNSYKNQVVSRTDETEDELCDITHDDSCAEELAIEKHCDSAFNTNLVDESSPTITEKLIKQEKTTELDNSTLSENLDENDHTNILNENAIEMHTSLEVNNSRETNLIDDYNEKNTIDDAVVSQKNTEHSETGLLNTTNATEINFNNFTKNSTSKFEETVNKIELNNTSYSSITDNVCQTEKIDPEQSKVIDFKQILENVRLQNERLSKREERLQKMEENCSEVVNKLSNTLNTGEQVSEKLNILHLKHQNCEINDETTLQNNTGENNGFELNSITTEKSEPSTSCEIDHEARFAARDLRLKRLEEQTKSLVNKVNKTTSKGVKINYKLEELHNIYGSESSRAGTPSEENEDKSVESETNQDSE